MIRVAIIGCGAVTERFHLPPLLRRKDCRVTALVDLNTGRTEALGRFVPKAVTAKSGAEVLDRFDAAIVAVPHFLHAPVSIELLQAGKSVLIEKPMALSSGECDAILAAARTSGASVTVGQMRRFCPAVAVARWLLDAAIFGEILQVDVRDGGIFSWPVESDFQFRKDKAGGGVLVDTGAHTFDMLIGWFGELRPLAYRDDSAGGVEADCEAELELPSGVPCFVELSRTRNLRNSAIIEGSRGRLEVSFYANKLTLLMGDYGIPFDCLPQSSALGDPSPWRHMFDFQLDDWLCALHGNRPALVNGREGSKVVRLFERLYSLREPLIHPWEVPSSPLVTYEP
jgi:predicted dehydrogenase